MVLPTVLKKRHSLRGIKLFPVIKHIKQGQSEQLKEYARLHKDMKTRELELESIKKSVRDLTGEELVKILDLADRELDVREATWTLHCLIIYTNEVGQPKGQELVDQSQTLGASTSTVSCDDNNNNKRKRLAGASSDDLEDSCFFREGC